MSNLLTAAQKRNSIIDIAKRELGVTEKPYRSNKTKYGKWYGFDGYAWCAMFVSWVYNKAGFPLGHINDAKGFRGCQSGYNHWRSTGELTKKPTKGDIVLFSWNNKGADHTGIFIQWLNSAKTRFESIEGNTSLSDNRNGGQVMIRKRSTSSVKAFVKPNVLLKNRSSSTISDLDILKKGNSGSDVASLQKNLLNLGYQIVVDGDFGPNTESIVKKFQKDNSLSQTGIVNPSTLGLIEDLLKKDKNIPDREFTSGTYLKIGDFGADVVELQKALNLHKIKPELVVDGDFGKKTDNNVRAFQKLKKITIDGIVGPQTWALLLNK